MLRDFVDANRGEILERARLRVAARNAPLVTVTELEKGLPIFLEQLRSALLRASRSELADHTDLIESAGHHGNYLFDQGLTVDQVVHDYGDLCQVITGLAVEQEAVIGTDEFRTLNLCLDDAIAGAVIAYVGRRERAAFDDGTERLGVLAHEMRNALNVSMLAFDSIKRGTVAPGGSTGAMLERSLTALQSLVDRSLSDVRLDAGIQHVERVAVREVIEEVAIGATLVAGARGVQFVVAPVDRTVFVEADRQILTAAIANLLQNAFKFTHVGTTVHLRASVTKARVVIEVEDECGGLPPGGAASLLRPYVQAGRDRTGLGLGLAICMKATNAMRGELRVLDLPGKGCIFTIDLPRQAAPAGSA